MPCVASCTGLSPPAVVPSNTFQYNAQLVCWSYNPNSPRKEGWFGLFPSRSPLLRESRLISLRRATEMFQFAHCPPCRLYIHLPVSRHHSGRVAPFGSSGLSARMQLPLNVSPVSASFFGLQRLGIHLVLSLACAPCRPFVSRSACVLCWCSAPHSRIALRPRHVCAETHASSFAFLCFSLLPWQY